MTSTDRGSETITDQERADLLAGLAHARHFLKYTARDLDTAQASECATVSELSIGGLIKHVTAVERGWADFIVLGAPALGKDFSDLTAEDFAERDEEFRMLPGDTLDGVLAAYDEIAARTDDLVQTVPSLDRHFDLPKAPWFVERSWSVRRVLQHIVAETAQHAGHADIIRESIDGAKSMG